MKKMLLMSLVGLLGLGWTSLADDSGDTMEVEAAQADPSSKGDAAPSEPGGKGAPHVDYLKSTYGVTDEQIAQMKGAGLTPPQMAVAAKFDQASDKSLDEILKMKTEQKMGWGQIAKALDVHPRNIGDSISAMKKATKTKRHEARAERKTAREERKEDRKEDREERKAQREERKAEREARKAERADKKSE